jgi:hypothetical protein
VEEEALGGMAKEEQSQYKSEGETPRKRKEVREQKDEVREVLLLLLLFLLFLFSFTASSLNSFMFCKEPTKENEERFFILQMEESEE